MLLLEMSESLAMKRIVTDIQVACKHFIWFANILLNVLI
ncbi:hypothetical protein D068_cds40650 [Bacillus atrophaeus UCMB-5137]|nr:hypothetical protein D068_cds40650 [Bacillus atrophaeus UCMB-5137]